MQEDNEAVENNELGHWEALAQKHWAKPLKSNKGVKPDLVRKEIWDVLEAESFEFRSLLQLEGLQLLERSREAPCRQNQPLTPD